MQQNKLNSRNPGIEDILDVEFVYRAFDLRGDETQREAVKISFPSARHDESHKGDTSGSRPWR